MDNRRTEKNSIGRIMQARLIHRKWVTLLLALAVVVSLGTFWTFRYTGISATYQKKVLDCQAISGTVSHIHNADDCYRDGELVCPLEEIEPHEHTEACYTAFLACGLMEDEGHHHTDDCYIPQLELTCGLEETEGDETHPAHKHTKTCYSPVKELICELEETEGDETHPAHKHTEECYEEVKLLNCGMEEGEGAHHHTEECYELVLICEKPVLPLHVHGPECFRSEEMTEEEIAAMDAASEQEPGADDAENIIDNTDTPAGKQEGASTPEDGQEQQDEGSGTDNINDSGNEINDNVTENGTDTAENTASEDTVNPNPAEGQEASGASEDGQNQNQQPEQEQQETSDSASEAVNEQPRKISFAGYAGDIFISVEAPAGAFQTGTEMRVKAVYDEKVLGELADAVDGNVVQVQAVDISFWFNGEEVEPLKPIRVVMTPAGVPDFDEQTVVHVDDAGETAVIEQENVVVPEAVFEVESFSVYGLVYTKIETTVLASDGNNYKITVTAPDDVPFPDNAKLWAGEVLAGTNVYGINYNEYLARTEYALGWEAGSASYIRMFDIFVGDQFGNKLTLSTPVDVTIKLADKDETAESKVVHFGNQVEVVNATTDGQTISFSANGFSIYAVVEGETPGENARIGYRFWYNDGNQNNLLSTQYFRYKDVHPTSGDPLAINEPSIPGVEAATWNRIFRGWSKNGFNDSDANLTNIAVLNSELSALSESEYIEGTYVDVYANLKNVYYVTYVDINPNNVLATEIVPVAESGNTTFTVKPATELRPAIDSDTELLGWYDINNPETVYSPGQENVVLNSNLTLYPKVEGGNWLIYNDNDLVLDGNGNMVSGGASFTPPAFYLNEVTEEPTEPVWAGYEFGGWYTDTACTTPFVFGEALTHDTTVYAKWIPSDSSYRVIIWKQRTSDDPDTPDANKTYDYVTSYLYDQNVVTGETVTLPNSYTRIYGNNGTSTDTDKGYFVYNADKTDQSVVVKADGSSVLNVYYDRKPVTLDYYIYDYTYTPTTGNNGTQYGLVDGQYVQLTRSGNTWTYVSGTEETYTPSSSTREGYYYIPNGNGGYERVYLYRYNNRWYRTRTWDWGWSYSDEYIGTVYSRSETDIITTYNGTRYTRGNNRSWRIYKSFTGLYGSTLAENGYTWPAEYDWYSNGGNNGSTSGTRTTFMASFLPTEVSTAGSTVTVNFYGSNPSGSYTIHFLTQNLDGTYTEKDTVAASGRSFYISDKYIGYHAVQYRADNGNWNSVGNKNNDGYYNNGNTVSFSNNLYIRFNLTDYTLTFYTNNGSNQVVNYTVPYSKSLTEYSGQNQGQREGYYFLGWYADPSCTEPFDFTQTMPDNNIAVYGKWKLRRVRVVVEPGADNVNMGSQAKQFRLDYDERADGGLMESATRAGYILDGWYTDPEFTNRFLFSNPVNDSTTNVAWDYQTSPQWAAERAAYGDDDEDHENVRGILHLYAKWIPDPNSIGINVVYDPGDAAIYDSLGNLLTTVPIDSHMYGFDGTATAREAPNNYSDLYTFKYWEATKTDGTTVIYHPSDPIALADLMASDIIYDEATGEELRHTVVLRAAYELTGDPSRQTTITYDGNTFTDTLYNGTTKEMQGKSADGTNRVTITLDKEVNQNIELPLADDFYLNGWTLVGWSFTKGTYEEQMAAATEDAPNFTPGQTVAADNLVISELNNAGNTLYAMWQPKTYTVTVKQVIEDGVPDHTFNYPYKTGAENSIDSAVQKVETLTNNSTFSVSDLGYYERTGDVIRITPPTIPADASYSVRVNAVVTHDDGTTEILNPTASGDYQILGDVVITYTYSPKVEVKLQKRDTTNHDTVLTGAQFTFTPVEFNTSTNRWENAGTGINLTVSEATFTSLLQEGTYRITETDAPEGYAKISDELFLTISHDSAFTLFTSSGGAVDTSVAELDTSGKILTVYDNPIRTVTLSKTVEDPTGIAESKTFSFTATIYESYENAETNDRLNNYEVGENLTTNSIGQVTINLAHDESVALNIPNGCWLTVSEAVDASYKTSYQWNSEASAAGSTFGETPIKIISNNTLVFTNKRITQDLKIRKITNDEEETGLAGAKFSLTATGTIDGFTDKTDLVSMSGANLGYLPSGDADDATLFTLPLGTYTLTETEAPENYDGLSDPVTLTVSADGITTSTEATGDEKPVTLNKDGDIFKLTVRNTHKMVTVTIEKNVDGTEADKDALYNFTAAGLTEEPFQLYGQKKTEMVDETETVVQANSKVFENIPFGTAFTITETDSADFDTAIVISREGKEPISITGKETGSRTVDGNVTITYTNTRNSQTVQGLKVNEGESRLADAVFSLYTEEEYNKGSSGEALHTGLTSGSGDNLGEIEIGKLALGTYYLVETQAPAGYNLLDKPVIITVERNQVVAKLGSDSVAPNIAELITPEEGEPYYQIKVHNNSGVALPMTGGPGAELFEAIGGIMMALAFAVLVIRKRRMA